MEMFATLDKVMKDYLIPTVPEIMNKELSIFGDVKKTKELWDGKKFKIPLQIGYNERGVGARGEDITLP
ncbi:MAG: hypothetical protein ACFFDT_11495, partial [Candidatus Hodarchaeota archaeon]